MPITAKFGVGVFNTRNDGTIWNELFHSDIESVTPVGRMGFMQSATTPNFTAVHLRFSTGFDAGSLGNQNVDKAYVAARNRDAQATPDRDQVGNPGAGGPGWIEAAAQTIYRTEVRTLIPGGFAVQRASGGFECTSSPAYSVAALVGSVEVAAGFTPQASIASGTITAESIGFEPDVVFFGNIFTYYSGLNFQTAANYGFGVVDCRSLRQRSINHTTWNITNKNPVKHLSAQGFVAQPVGSAAPGGEPAIVFRSRVSSRDNNGFYVQTDLNPYTIVGTQNYSYLAVKFNEALANWRVDEFKITGLTVPQTAQTNSLFPQFVLTMCTNIETLDFSTPSHSAAGETMGVGLATDGNGYGATWSEQTSLSTWENITFASTGFFGNTFTAPLRVRYRLEPPTMGENGFSYTEAGSQGNHVGEYVAYIAIGEAVNAPDHLQQEDGTSIFLTETENFDDLLLIEEPPTGFGPFRRDFPVHTRRDFPDPINFVRDFPNE